MTRKTTLLLIVIFHSVWLTAQPSAIDKQLQGFDQYMAQTLQAWNCPGACVGIVVKDKLVFAKGYGYRELEKKLPVTPNTLYQIASNTKLFTTMAAGMLVEQGKLNWDKPIKNDVPSIAFYNNDLNNTVTLHDMLSHRTGISRHDNIWYHSDFTQKDLFEKLQYLEPSQPLRQAYIYNNLMYIATGYIIELLTGHTWKNFVSANILSPLRMTHTVFSTSDMLKQPDFAVPYNEKRDTNTLRKGIIYKEMDGLSSAGGIISSVNDMSHWLIALMNNGKYEGKQVLPVSAIKASLTPSIPVANTNLEKGYNEALSPVYCMGREQASYRGHLLVYHGGDIDGFHSDVSYMPQDSIGVVVFLLGDQSSALYPVLSYNIYERLLNMSLTPWGERMLKEHTASRKISKEAGKKVNVGKVAGTKPSHAPDDYPGDYENPAYGIINISKTDTAFQFRLHNMVLPLYHYHYDRFDTPNDELYGIFALNFQTNPQGDIDRFVVSLDEQEATFIRKPDSSLSGIKTLSMYLGKYQIGGTLLNVILQNENQLTISINDEQFIHLIPYKPRLFRTKEFADMTVEFVLENDRAKALKIKQSSGEYEAAKKQE